jgi:hypothetical protein
MIVRRRDTRFVVDVCKNLEAKLRIFVQDLESAWHCITAIFFDKIPVGQQSLEIDADLFAAGSARVACKDIAAVGDELIEIIRHGAPPGHTRREVIFAHYTTVHQGVLGAGVAARTQITTSICPALSGN